MGELAGSFGGKLPISVQLEKRKGNMTVHHALNFSTCH